MNRYSLEVIEEGIMLFDSDKKMMMPVTLEQVEILLNFQDKIIKELKSDVDD